MSGALSQPHYFNYLQKYKHEGQVGISHSGLHDNRGWERWFQTLLSLSGFPKKVFVVVVVLFYPFFFFPQFVF